MSTKQIKMLPIEDLSHPNGFRATLVQMFVCARTSIPAFLLFPHKLNPYNYTINKMKPFKFQREPGQAYMRRDTLVTIITSANHLGNTPPPCKCILAPNPAYIAMLPRITLYFFFSTMAHVLYQPLFHRGGKTRLQTT